MNLNQPKGTKHTPQNRMTLSGKVIPIEQPRADSWEELVAPGPAPKAKEVTEGDGPRQSFVVLENVPHAPRNAPARRTRRPAQIAQAKAARKAAR